MVAPVHHLVGPSEVARMLGVSRQRVSQLAGKPGFPKPEVVLDMGTVWSSAAIREWAAATGRVVVEDVDTD